jgi:hypothetical protein
LVDDLGTVETDDSLVLIGLPMREVLLSLIWLRVLVVGDFPALEPEFANILPLKELLEDCRALEEIPDFGVARLGAVPLGVLLRVTLELLLVEGLEVLTLALLAVEGLEVLTLALLVVEGLEVLTLALLVVEGLEVLTLALLVVEGLEVLILALLVVEGLEVLTLDRGADVDRLRLALEDCEALGAGELFATVRLLPLDLLLRLCFAKTGPESNITAETIDTKTALRFFECFRVTMAYLLIFQLFFPIHMKPKSIFNRLHHYKITNKYQKTLFQEPFMAPVPSVKGSKLKSGNRKSMPKSPCSQ